MRKLRFVWLLVGSLIAPASVHADLIATLSDTAPTTDILDSFDGSGDAYYWQYMPDASPEMIDVGQQFRPLSLTEGSYIVDKITVYTKEINAGAAGRAFDLRLFDFGAGDTTVPVGGPISLQKGWMTEAAGLRYITFDIDDVTLDANRVYGFMLDFVAPENDQFVRLICAGDFTGEIPNQGTTLQPLTSTDGTTFMSGIGDLTYYIQGSAVPEPALLPLILGLGAGLGLRRHGKRPPIVHVKAPEYVD